MNSTSTIPVLLPTILLRLPFLLVCLAGIVIGLIQLSSHRKPATFVILGSGLLGLGSAISLGSTALSLHRVQTGGSHTELAAILGVLGVVQGLLSAAGYGVLIYAAFVGRNAPKVAPPAFGSSTERLV